MRTILFTLFLVSFFSVNLFSQIFANFEKIAPSGSFTVNIQEPVPCQGFPLQLCGTYTLPPLNYGWELTNIINQDIEFETISINPSEKSFCIEISDLNPGSNDCKNVTFEMIFTNSATNNQETVPSNTLIICTDQIECECLFVELIDTKCYDNGTSTELDDYWTFDILVISNSDSASSWTTEPFLGDGQYGVVTTILPGFISDFPEVILNIFDSNNPECKTELNVVAPLSCSEECNLSVSAKISECNFNDTPFSITDDFYTVDLGVMNSGSVPFTITQVFADGTTNILAQGTQTGEINLGPFIILDGNWVLEASLDDGSCIVETLIIAPDFCSGCHDIVYENVTCDNNGTPEISDDSWSFDLLVNGGTGPEYYIKGDINLIGQYGEINTITINEVEECISFSVYDSQDSVCITDFSICPPDNCTDFCPLQMFAYPGDCLKENNQNGTLIYFELILQVAGTEGDCWEVTKINKNEPSESLGQYEGDQQVILEPFEPGINFSLEVSLCDDPDCAVSQDIIAPACDGFSNDDIEMRKDKNISTTLYPNPVYGNVINIESGISYTSYSIIDVQGNTISKGTLSSGKQFIELDPGINSGFYIVRLENINGENALSKFIKY